MLYGQDADSVLAVDNATVRRHCKRMQNNGNAESPGLDRDSLLSVLPMRHEVRGSPRTCESSTERDALARSTKSCLTFIQASNALCAYTIPGDADHVTAMYASFSEYPAGPDGPPLIMPGTTRVMNNVRVWIVTFHGAHILHSGPCNIDANGNQIPSTRDPYVFGDANVVLDAETGEVLEGFSYNTPPGAQN